jgi:hypothetical protein
MEKANKSSKVLMKKEYIHGIVRQSKSANVGETIGERVEILIIPGQKQ